MTLTARLAFAALLPVAILVAVIVHHHRLVDGVVREHRRLAEIDVALQEAALELRTELARLDDLAAKASALGDPEYAEEAERAERAISERIEVLDAMQADPAERRAVEAVVAAWSSRDGPDGGAPTEAAVDGLLEAAGRTARRRVALGTERADRAREIARAATMLGIGAAVGLSTLLGWSIIRPVRRMARATDDLAEGFFDRRVEPTGPPELVALAEDFNVMAERLGELDRLKEDLLSNVSHELKAPLASMLETVRLLLDGIPGPVNERQERLLSLTLESGERLSLLIENLLDLSRLQAGAMAFELERRDIGELVRRVVEPYEVSLRERGVELVTRWPDAPVGVVCDPSRIAQVVDNLVSNAVKFTPRGGTVRVRLRENGSGGAILEVEDEGPGIPDEQKPRIFERFFRADPSRKGSQGTGLGLAIALEIVAAHQGTLEVRDARDGGSVFALELPSGPAAEA